MGYLFCVDDDEMIRGLVNLVLKKAGHEVLQIADGESVSLAVAAREPELIVLDIDLPGITGIEVCQQIKRNPFTARIPILMLTGRGEIEQKIEGFDAGADDYLSKPFHPKELLARVEALLRIVRRESDRNPTSGLPGSRAIREEIEKRAQLARQSGEAFAICYLDLDHFKPFADTFGFEVADAVIARTGAMICDVMENVAKTPDAKSQNTNNPVLRHHHFAGHIGGDDFILVASEAAATEIAQQCAARFSQVVADVLGQNTQHAAVLRSGVFSGLDREGQAREFRLAHLTAAIVRVDGNDQVSIGHIGIFASELKRQAKQRGTAILQETYNPSVALLV